MNCFYFLLLLLFLPYSSKCFTVTTLPPLKGYFFLNQTHLINNVTWGNCLQKFWSKNAANVSTCTLFSWNIDYPTTKTLQQWVSDQFQGKNRSYLIYYKDETAATNEYIFAQIYVDADNMPKISKSTYRRIGEHHFQWRFDPFYVSKEFKRIIVRYKRKTTCLRPHTFVLQTFEQSLFVESCSPFEILSGGFSTSLRTLEEFPLPIIPPINESDYKPIKKEDIPIFNPKGYNETEFSTAMPEEITFSTTVSINSTTVPSAISNTMPTRMPHSTAMPEEITYSTATMPTGTSHSTTVSKEMPQSTTVPKKVSHSTTVSKNSTTVPPAISNTVPTGMSHPPTIVPPGMPPSSQEQSSVASAGITAPWLWGVLIICCILLIIIIAFGSILLYLFYKMKPMIIFDKIFIPATVEKSVQSKKDPQIPAATLADTKGGVENMNAYDGLDLKTPKRSSKEAKSGKRKKQKKSKSKSNPFEPAWKQPSKQPPTPKKSKKLNEVSISSKRTSNASKDSIEKAYKGEINVDRSGKDSKDTTFDILADENDKSKSNH